MDPIPKTRKNIYKMPLKKKKKGPFPKKKKLNKLKLSLRVKLGKTLDLSTSLTMV